ncbi:MAG TPA: hypothetical protein VIJ87_18365, partial [Pyrinomonadaceae bacterium]
CYTVRYDFGYSEEFRPQIYANQRAREAGDGIKPGAQAPGKSSLNRTSPRSGRQLKRLTAAVARFAGS